MSTGEVEREVRAKSKAWRATLKGLYLTVRARKAMKGFKPWRNMTILMFYRSL